MTDETFLHSMVAMLTDPSRAIPAADFPPPGDAAQHPGLYSWWPDEHAADVLSSQLGHDLSQPIYVGQAGAASKRSAKVSDATLASRIGRNHIGGNLRSSTFRLTIGSLLREPLGLALIAPTKLVAESNAVLTDWIRKHLSVAIVPIEDRLTLASVEDRVLEIIDPPLNLMGMGPSPVRTRLRALRKGLQEP